MKFYFKSENRRVLSVTALLLVSFAVPEVLRAEAGAPSKDRQNVRDTLLKISAEHPAVRKRAGEFNERRAFEEGMAGVLDPRMTQIFKYLGTEDQKEKGHDGRAQGGRLHEGQTVIPVTLQCMPYAGRQQW